MKTWIRSIPAWAMALVMGTLLTAQVAKAQDNIMTYSLDIVSGYVIRGDDQYIRVYAKEEKEHAAFLATPAFQPSFTFFGPPGISLNLWGSFALTERADDVEKGFIGLGRDDELDYTLNFDWSNKLGGFTASLIYYTYFSSCYGTTETRCVKSTQGSGFPLDARITWMMPFAKTINPYFAFTSNQTPGGWYASLGISGGESIVWAAVADEVAGGLKAVTAKIGYVLGDMTVALWAAYRPNPTLLNGGYDKDGKYTVKGEEKTYPSTLAWLSFSYGGSVAK
jgi:hypothetical protein